MEIREIQEIPANPLKTLSDSHRQLLRVAAYCRVSTEEEEQQNSFAIQVEYYTSKISNHEGWQLAGIFADEGISGVRTKNRIQFNEMIELCKKKKIDLILTKSISRFARNTLDCVGYVRQLKSWGIAVIFEKENINTASMNSEMILTCLSSFAQAESESISGNVTRGIRMGYKQGKFAFRYKNCLGYRKGPDGTPEIIPDHAEMILAMYLNYLNGDSLSKIKADIESKNFLTATGNKEWSTESIFGILKNEKYMGAVLRQKTYISDFIEKTVKKNNGELPQYYIENNHPAIVPKEIFFRVQEEIARRQNKRPAAQKKAKTNRGKFSSKYALSERLVCGTCGSRYRRITWNIHGRKQIVWRCISRLEFGKKYCGESPSIPEVSLHQSILFAIKNVVQGHQQELISSLQQAVSNCTNETEKQAAMNYRKCHLNELEKEFDRLLALAGDEENDFIDRRLKQVSNEILELSQTEKAENTRNRQSANDDAKVNQIASLVLDESLCLENYSDVVVYRIIERITVISKDKLRIRYIGGYETTQEIK